MDSEKDAVTCIDNLTTNKEVENKNEPCISERTCSGIKVEPDSDDGLQNQIVPSTYSPMEYKNSDLTSDDCASDMKTEVKEESWCHGSILSDSFQPELSSSQSQTKSTEDFVEGLQKYEASTSKNVNEMLIPGSYAWYPTTTRIRPFKAAKYSSKDVARAVRELRQLQESISKEISQNQFDIFGRSVAVQLKTIPYYKALLAQSQIQTLLTNAAIEAFHSSVG